MDYFDTLSSPSSMNYEADSEGSDWDYLSSDSSPRQMIMQSYKAKGGRSAMVRSSSEEELYEKSHHQCGHQHCYSTNAVSSFSSEEEKQEQQFKHGNKENVLKHNTKSALKQPDDDSLAASAPSSSAASGTGSNNPVVGIQAYSKPTGHTFSQGPVNPVYLHTTTTSGFHQVQPVLANSSDCPQLVQFAGQPYPYLVNTGSTANMNQPNNHNIGPLNFQPQTPDTTFGPMLHTYIPRFDNGFHVVAQSGIVPQGIPVVGGGNAIIMQPYATQPMMTAPGAPPPPSVPPQVIFAGGMGPGGSGQPYYMNGGMMMMAGNAYPGFIPMNGVHYEPATGVGQTASEVTAAGLMNDEANQPQDFKPADDNPSRMYWVRQLDGHYILMSRATIDSFGPDGCRWYVKDDGVFYAVRLEE